MLERAPRAWVLMPDATSQRPFLAGHPGCRRPGERLWGCSDGQAWRGPCSKGRDQKGVTGRRVLRKAAPSGEAKSGRQTSLTGLQSSCRSPSPDLILKASQGGLPATLMLLHPGGGGHSEHASPETTDPSSSSPVNFWLCHLLPGRVRTERARC